MTYGNCLHELFLGQAIAEISCLLVIYSLSTISHATDKYVIYHCGVIIVCQCTSGF